MDSACWVYRTSISYLRVIAYGNTLPVVVHCTISPLVELVLQFHIRRLSSPISHMCMEQLGTSKSKSKPKSKSKSKIDV